MSAFTVGLDLGQTNDYTALAVIERVETAYHLRHLERPAIGTPYTEVVRHVCDLLNTSQLRGAPLVLDRTGVGRAVYDMFALANLPGGVVPITIHGGDAVLPDGDGFRVPKRDLVGILQAMMQPAARRLLIANGLSLGPVFAAEALNFQAKINLSGHDSYEAGAAGDWRDGAHDDIVLAVSLACWYAERPQQPRIRSFNWDD